MAQAGQRAGLITRRSPVQNPAPVTKKREHEMNVAQITSSLERGDPEGAHSNEDDFLREIVRAVATGTIESDIVESALAYISWWDHGGKDCDRWYA